MGRFCNFFFESSAPIFSLRSHSQIYIFFLSLRIICVCFFFFFFFASSCNQSTLYHSTALAHSLRKTNTRCYELFCLERLPVQLCALSPCAAATRSPPQCLRLRVCPRRNKRSLSDCNVRPTRPTRSRLSTKTPTLSRSPYCQRSPSRPSISITIRSTATSSQTLRARRTLSLARLVALNKTPYAMVTTRTMAVSRTFSQTKG